MWGTGGLRVFSVLSRNLELIGRVDLVIEPKFSFLF